MSELRIKIRLGEREFEIEGSAESVERQFEAFKWLIAPPPDPTPVKEPLPEPPTPALAVERVPLERIMRIRGAIISLSVSSKVHDAVLVILLGQRIYRQNDNVSGIEVMEGLRDSGIRVPRVDLLLSRYARLGIVVAMGQHRRRRYRLSTAGVEQAQQIAHRLIALVPSPSVESAQG